MKNKGFTFIELITILAIIAILAGMLLPAINMVREGSIKVNASKNIIGKEVKIKNKDLKGTVLSMFQYKPRIIYLVRIYKGSDATKMYEEVKFFDTELEGLPE